MIRIIIIALILLGCKQSSTQTEPVSAVNFTEISNQSGMIVSERFYPPPGYRRIKTDTASFSFFLQNFKLKEDGTKVLYYNGRPKPDQTVHAAILDIDVGTRDLQQCADAVMRLRGEFLFFTTQYEQIAFNFVSDGKPRYFLEHSGQKTDYESYRKYMNYVFAYANTRSLKNQLNAVMFENMQIGDVLIQSGNPYGHAVIVIDMAINNKGEKLFLLAQSYMPAQDIHILKNPINNEVSPWYELNLQSEDIITPEWKFSKGDLRRF